MRIDGHVGQAYNEVAFRYFLEIERKRAARTVRPLLLILVKLIRPSDHSPEIVSRLFAAVFSVLSACVREVDFVGWYREGAVAAAVLAPSGPASEAVRHRVSARVLRALRERLAPDDAARIGVRVVVLGRPPRM